MQKELATIANQILVKENGMPLQIYTKLEPDEIKVAIALDTMSIGRCSPIEVKEHLKSCIALSGCQIPSIESFQFISEFVIKNYANYKLKELGVAFELYAMGKLSVDKAITFNPKFFGDVMSAYKPIAVQVRQKTYNPPQIELDVPKLDDNEVLEALHTNWEKSSKKDWKLLNTMAFDILWKQKILNKENMTKEIVEKIKAKVMAYYKVNAKNDKDLLKLNDELFIRNECKRYSLYLYLQNQL
jgi:hypothetical protein